MPVTDETNACMSTSAVDGCAITREDLLASHQAAISRCEEEFYLQHNFSTIQTAIGISASILVDEETSLNLYYSAANSGQIYDTGPLGCNGGCGDVPLGARDFTPYANEPGLLPRKTYRENVIDSLLGLLDYIVISDGE